MRHHVICAVYKYTFIIFTVKNPENSSDVGMVQYFRKFRNRDNLAWYTKGIPKFLGNISQGISVPFDWPTHNFYNFRSNGTHGIFRRLVEIFGHRCVEISGKHPWSHAREFPAPRATEADWIETPSRNTKLMRSAGKTCLCERVTTEWSVYRG